MSLHLKKTSIALAVAAVTGVTFAAPTTDIVLTDLEPTKTVENGQIKKDPATGYYQESVATTVGKGRQSIDDNSNNNTADATKNQATYSKQVVKNNEATGTVTIKQNQKTDGTVTVNAEGQITSFVPTDGTTTNVGTETKTFAPADVNKAIDANTNSYENTQENVTYVTADEKASSHDYVTKSSNLTTKKKLGADGKQVADQTIRTGTVAYENTDKGVTYKRDIVNGKLVSKNASGVLSNDETSTASHTVSEAYETNATGDVVAFKLSADKKAIYQSTVNTDKTTSADKTVNYDDVSEKKRNYEKTQTWDHSNESLLDGLVDYSRTGKSTQNDTDFNQAVLGKSNALQSIRSSSYENTTKQRDFVKNAADEIVLTNGKPTVNTETVNTVTNENYTSRYQPTRDKDGNPVQIDNNRWGSTGSGAIQTGEGQIQKSVVKSSTSKTVTHKTDNDFQEYWNSTSENTAEYARNFNENIEVDRTLVGDTDYANQAATTSNKKELAKKVVGTVETKAGENSQFALGTVRVTDTGRVLTEADVKKWKDADGKDRYYVIVGQDADGRDIRSEVTFKNGKPSEFGYIEVDVVNTAVTANKRTDKVTMGEEVAYNTNRTVKNETATTSKDGSIVYESDKYNQTTDTNVYSIGKNALDYQKVVEGSNATVKSDYKLDANNKVVVTAVNSTNDTWKNTTQQFQPGQEKKSVQSNAGTWNDTKTVDGIEVAYDRGTDEKITTQYNTGKNELDRTIVSKATSETKDQGLVTISTNIRPVNENGNKITAGGVLAVDENGQNVVSKATNTVATVKTDTVTKTTNNVDEKVYQTGVTAYSKVESDSSDAVITYSDNTTGYAKSANSSDVKLYNHGESDKYRDFTSLNTSSSKGNQYALDDAGKAVLAYTEEKSNSTAKTEADYQAGKNALDNSRNTVVKNTNTKTSADKTVATKDATTTDVLTYQKGQELNTSTKVVAETEKTTTTAAATEAITDKTTTDTLVYQEGHELQDTSTVASAGQEKLTKADGTGYTYTTSGKAETKNYSSRMGLLASGEVKQSSKTEATETLAQTGKSTVSITRGTEAVARTDSSFTAAQYGSETVTAADGSTTTVAKKVVTEADKLAIVDSTTQTRTETKVAADKSSTSNTATRVDSVNGIVVSATKTQTDAAGKATTTESKTTIDANSVTTNHVVAERITLQGGKDLQGEITRIDSRVDTETTDRITGDAATLSSAKGYTDTKATETLSAANAYTNTRVDQLNSRVDDVQKTAYRGIAIALAAQQAVPNIGPGQVAVFGGVGHYEGETAASIGVVTSFTDRISASGAFGFAGGSEFGGRVGVAYVFGGK